MNLDSIVRFLLPKEDHFYDFLEKQAAAAHEAAQVFARFRQEGVTAATIREDVQKIEHAGDALVHGLEEALAKTFVTPIDREDLQKVSAELDDVLDLTNGAARVCVLFGVTRPTQPMMDLVDKLVECTLVLKTAVPLLRKHKYSELIEAVRVIKGLEKEADTIFRDAIGRLFHDDAVDAKKLIREREVLDDLEKAVDHCDHVASTLANLAVKHG